jgi:chromosome segregation ATPase
MVWCFGAGQASARVGRLEEELVSLKAREGAAREQAQTLEAQVRQLQTDRDAAADQVPSLQQQLGQSSERLAQAEAEAAAAAAKGRFLEERLSAVEEQKAAAERSAEEYMARAKSLGQELEEQVGGQNCLYHGIHGCIQFRHHLSLTSAQFVCHIDIQMSSRERSVMLYTAAGQQCDGVN